MGMVCYETDWGHWNLSWDYYTLVMWWRDEMMHEPLTSNPMPQTPISPFCQKAIFASLCDSNSEQLTFPWFHCCVPSWSESRAAGSPTCPRFQTRSETQDRMDEDEMYTCLQPAFYTKMSITTPNSTSYNNLHHAKSSMFR